MGEIMEWLNQVLLHLQIEVSLAQKRQLCEFVELIVDGMKRQRLMGTADPAVIVEKHIYDALYPLTVFSSEMAEGELLDLGTGAGFPGIPLKICRPENPLYLMDANRRKVNFLRAVAEKLNLKGVGFLPGRAEIYGINPSYRERFPMVACRAVAAAPILMELALPLVAVGGKLLLYKGLKGGEEMEEAKGAMDLCGGELIRSCRYHLPTGEERTLFLVGKRAKTPPFLPRPPGRPEKTPLR